MNEPAGDPVEETARAHEKAIRDEMDSMISAIKELAARSRKLGVGARAINGLQGATATWSRDLLLIATKLEEEIPEVTKALLGREPVPMVEFTSEPMMDAIREAKKREQP